MDEWRIAFRAFRRTGAYLSLQFRDVSRVWLRGSDALFGRQDRVGLRVGDDRGRREGTLYIQTKEGTV
jgi:hypothetical protein